MDFAIALLLFIFTLVVYFSYTGNLQKQEKGDLDSMLADAKAISSSLVLSGYPVDWDNETVIKIGIADDQKASITKIKYFKQLNYSKTKANFGTSYDYFVFFVNNNGEVLNVSGVCGIGSPLVNTSYGSIQGTCNPINVTGIAKNKFVKTERYLSYNSSIIKMVVYVWG